MSYDDAFCCNLCNLCSAFKSPDFAWVFASRFFIQLGIITVQENLQAYLKDTVNPGQYKVNDFRVATSEVEAVTYQNCFYLDYELYKFIASKGGSANFARRTRDWQFSNFAQLGEESTIQ